MKNYIFFLLFVAASHSIFAQERALASLMWYPFNADTRDYSGNNFHGTANGTGDTLDRFGNQNAARYFDGIDDYVALPNEARLKPQLPVSIMYWVRFDNLAPQYTTIFTNDFSTSAHSGVWTNLSSDGRMTVSYGDNTGFYSANRRTKIGTTSVTKEQWNHVALIVRGANDMDIYLNCENDGGTYSGTGGTLTYGNYYTGSVGRKDANAGDNTYYFKGALDDLKYYDRVISYTEIQNNCNYSQSAVISIPEKKLLVYPNPTSTKINVNSTEKFDMIEIFSIDGTEIYQTQNSETVDVSNLSSGIYIIKVTSQKTGYTETTKFNKK